MNRIAIKKTLFIIVLIVLPMLGIAQSKFANTISYNATAGSPQATLHDIAWIQGHWRGTAFGGATEEIWSPPLHGSMMGVFKASSEEGISFYELMTITESDSTLLFRLKHFDENLSGWEKQDETVDFKLVQITDNRVYFDEFTFEYISDREINVYVVVDNKGKESELKFNYRRFLPEVNK